MDPKSIFDTLSPDKIRSFIEQEQEEHLHLDFKTIVKSELSDKNDKRNLAIVLSGFANSDGGVVIWGVKARPNTRGIDCACGEVQIQDLKQFISKLNEFTGQFVSPIIERVIHRPITVKGDGGFGATLVPSSLSGPHMAKGGEDRYYKRSGSAFYRMEHFDLEDMFGRRQRPLLQIWTKIIKTGTTTTGNTIVYSGLLVVGIMNKGRGIAKAPYLSISVHNPYRIDHYGLDGNRNEGLPRLRSSDATAVQYGGGYDTVIHPKTSREVAAVAIEVKVVANREPKADPLTLQVEFAADEAPLMEDTIRVSHEDLIKALVSEQS